MLLVSGDRESEVRYLAEQVGIEEVHFSQTPEQKLELVRAETAKRATTLFLGDGINDAPALAAATVGIAFGQNSDVTAEAAGAVVLDSSLQRVDEFLHIGRRMRRDRAAERGRRHGALGRRHGLRRRRLARRRSPARSRRR